MTTPERTTDASAIQAAICRVALEARHLLDLDGFIETAEALGSPEAVAQGMPLAVALNAPDWARWAYMLRAWSDDVLAAVTENNTPETARYLILQHARGLSS